MAEAKRPLDPPFVLPETVRLEEDIVFASPGGVELALDVFRPVGAAAAKATGGALPAVVYVHGGGWRGGSRRAFWRHAAYFAERGWLGITPTYRFTPDHRYPAQLEDAQAAVRWLRERAGAFGIDPERVVAIGASSGGHLAALLGTTDAVKDGVSARVQGVVAISGVFDFPTYDVERTAAAVRALLGDDPKLAISASPLRRADAGAAPTLLLHGTADQGVPFGQAVAYQRRLRELGVRAELDLAEGAPHNYWHRPPYYQPVLDSEARFLESLF